MSAKYEELIEAGAPRLPEGYYYKIRDWSDSDRAQGVHVQVRKERAWWFDQRKGAASTYGGVALSVVNLGELCQLAWSATERMSLPEHIKPFLGRHP